MKQRLQSLAQNSSELLIEASPGQSVSSARIHQGSVGFDIIWSEETPALAGYRSVFFDPMVSGKLSHLSINLTENLAGGERVAPVATALLAFGASIASRLSAYAVMWTPGKIVSDPAFFAQSVESYAKGEVFPVLVTVDFDYNDDERALRSSGLMWFSGQEIEVSGCGLQGQDLVRRAVRLVHDIATNGAVVVQQQVPDLDPDKRIALIPNPDGDILHCEIYSKVEKTTGVTSLH